MKKLFVFIILLSLIFIFYENACAAQPSKNKSLSLKQEAVGQTNSILIPIESFIKRDKTLIGHSNYILSVAFSSDGKIIASGSSDQTIILWDVTTGRKIKTLTGHSYSVNSVAFSSDGRTMASGGGYKDIILWDVATGNIKKVLTGHSGWVKAIAFSSDGRTLASGGLDKNIILWDVATGDKVKVLKSHTSSVESVQFSPDAKILASGNGDKEVILWDVATAEEIKVLKGHSKTVESVVFSPDGKTLASGSDDTTIILWDVATGSKIKTLEHHLKSIFSVSFSPDGKKLASGGDGKTIIIWDAKSGNHIKSLTGHSEGIRAISFSPDGKKIASGSADNTVILWDISGIFLHNEFEKGELETNKEYEERVRKIEYPYSATIALGKYNADKEMFEGEISGYTFFINTPRTQAKEIINHKDKVYIKGILKYFDNKFVQLINASLDVLNAGEEPMTTYIPKPAIQEAPIENIHDIPDFELMPRPNDLAVIIGIESYQGLPKSDYSKSDAGIMKDYLKALGFQERNIEFVTDEKATKSKIETAIEGWLPNKVKKGSSIIVYYSGHGAPEPKTGDAYIVPYDGDPNYLPTSGYSLKRLYDNLGKLQVAEITVVLDSCFSGAGGRSVLAQGARPLVMMTTSTVLPSNMAVLSATQGSQISTSSPEKGHGIFTYYFLKAIKDGKKDIAEIYEYIKPLVEDEAKQINVQQSPSISPDVEKLRGRFGLRK